MEEINIESNTLPTFSQVNVNERDLLNIIKTATAHPSIPPIDLGLSGRVLVDHVIGRFEEVINDHGYTFCPQIIKDGYHALQQLYPLHFRNSKGYN